MMFSPHKVKHMCSVNTVTTIINHKLRKMVTERHGKQNSNNLLSQSIMYQ